NLGKNILGGTTPTEKISDVGIFEGKIPTGILGPSPLPKEEKVIVPKITPPRTVTIPKEKKVIVPKITPPRTVTIPIEKEITLEKTLPFTKTITIPKEKEEVISKVSPVTALATPQVTKQKTIQKTTQVPKNIFLTPTPTPTPTRIRGFPLITPIKLSRKRKTIKKVMLRTPRTGGYYAYGKSKGKWKRLNKVPVKKSRARDIGSYLTDTSLSLGSSLKRQ
ncbi:unnamed protein product, partial [marine sediment metagenome]